MSTIIEYAIVTMTDGPKLFEKQVNELLKNGWSLYGPSFSVGDHVTQALVLEKPEIVGESTDVEKPKEDVEEPALPTDNVCPRCRDTGWIDEPDGGYFCWCKVGVARKEWSKDTDARLAYYQKTELDLKRLREGLAKILKYKVVTYNYDGFVLAAEIEALLKETGS